MYRCEHCQKNVNVRTKASRVVTHTRNKVYPERWIPEVNPRNGKTKWIQIDFGGEGQEIVREKTMCPECADQFGKISGIGLAKQN